MLPRADTGGRRYPAGGDAYVKKWRVLAGVLATVVVIALVAGGRLRRGREGQRAGGGEAATLTAPPARPRDEPIPEEEPAPAQLAGPGAGMLFVSGPAAGAQTNSAAAITKAVGRVIGPGRAATAVCASVKGAQWVCVLVDSPQKCYELDAGWAVSDFPVLDAMGFQPPSGPVSRTMSIYRSAAKKAVGYSRDRGDRVAVLLCPRELWSEHEFCWPSE